MARRAAGGAEEGVGGGGLRRSLSLSPQASGGRQAAPRTLETGKVSLSLSLSLSVAPSGEPSKEEWRILTGGGGGEVAARFSLHLVPSLFLCGAVGRAEQGGGGGS
jgi:hypothetical protein